MRWLVALAFGAALGGVVALALLRGTPAPELGGTPPPGPAVPEELPPEHGGPTALPAERPDPTAPERPDPFAACRPLRDDWVEMSSDRFRILGALSRERVTRLAELGVGVGRWLDETWGGAARPGPARCIVVPDFPSFAAVCARLGMSRHPAGVLGVYLHGWDCLVTYDHPGLEQTLIHECFHAYVAYRASDAVPTWFNEGYASYFGTAEWSGHAVRFRDQHHAAFAAMRAALLIGEWIPLAELVAMSPAEFYDPERVHVAYLQSYCVAFALEHLLPRELADWRLTTRALALRGETLSDASTIARLDAEVQRVVWDAVLPPIPDLAERLRGFAPEAALADRWDALAAAYDGSEIHLPTGAAADRLAAALRERLRRGLQSSNAAVRAMAALALLDDGAGALVAAEAAGVGVTLLDEFPPLAPEVLLAALERRAGEARAPVTTGSEPGPDAGPTVVAELLWQLERALFHGPDPASALPPAMRERLRRLELPEWVLGWSGAGLLAAPLGAGRDVDWGAWNAQLTARARSASAAARPEAAARAIGRVVRGATLPAAPAGAEAAAQSAQEAWELAGQVSSVAARAALLRELAQPGVPVASVAARTLAAWVGNGVGRSPVVVDAVLRTPEPPLPELLQFAWNAPDAATRAAVLRHAPALREHLPVAEIENLSAGSDPLLQPLALRALGCYAGARSVDLLQRAVREQRDAAQLAAVGGLLRLLRSAR